MRSKAQRKPKNTMNEVNNANKIYITHGIKCYLVKDRGKCLRSRQLNGTRDRHRQTTPTANWVVALGCIRSLFAHNKCTRALVLHNEERHYHQHHRLFAFVLAPGSASTLGWSRPANHHLIPVPLSPSAHTYTTYAPIAGAHSNPPMHTLSDYPI